MDPTEILNPKKTLNRRMSEQGLEAPAAAASAPTGGTSKFTKAFTPEEKKRQAGKLAEMLRKRGE